METEKQAEINLGMIGHVDHGKTTLTHALTGKWADTHSEELKRGITIRLGYADFSVRKCGCGEYTISETCGKCGKKTKLLRKIAIVDAPGHETLMTVMLSGAGIMDGAVLVIAANEPCPQPQTREHLMALEIIGVKNIVIVQNKIDLVSKEKALKNKKSIQNFVKGTIAEKAPIIPIAAHYKTNLGVLLQAIEEKIPTPKHDPSKDPKMYICRSFDVNKPGTSVEKLLGGVIGGSLIQGQLKQGDAVEIRPGLASKKGYTPILTKAVSIDAGGKRLKAATPGGLIAVATNLDPSLTKTDSLVGNIVGKPGKLPQTLQKVVLETTLMKRIVGLKEDKQVIPIQPGETLVLNIGTATTIGSVENIKKKKVTFSLKRPVCSDPGERVAISRRIENRWHLIGYGIIQENNEGSEN